MSTLSDARQTPIIDPMRYEIVRKILLAVVLAVGLAACSDEGSSSQASWYQRNTLYSYSGDHGNLWDRMRGDMHMSTYSNTPQVREEIRYFQHHQDYLNHIIAESAPYIYYIYQQTQKRHLPAELALIPVIESEYNPYAKSNVGALGLWQMMPGTARGFGLKRDFWYDGRKDVVASTGAALEYFTYLHSYFNNNWLLAIGAYDCGEGTVMACERYNEVHHRSGDFWDLPLPNETQNYVPRLLAVAAIVKHPSYYGIHLAPINDEPYIEQINVGSPIALSKAANMAEVPLTTMKVLNPAIQHGTTDPRGPYTLLVPEDKAETFKQKLGLITKNEKIAWQKHVVQSKETLEKIAEKYQTTVAMLRQVNGLKSDKVHLHEALLIPPPNTNDNNTNNDNKNTTSTLAVNQTENASSSANVTNNDGDNTTADKNSTSSSETPQKITYTVKHHDKLAKIADKYHVTSKQILAWNKLSHHHHLRPGEKLVIMIPPKIASNETDTTDASSSTDQNQSTQSKDVNNTNVADASDNSLHSLPITYQVQNDDDLNKIAHKFHVSVSHLKETNKLASNTVKVGQVLTIPTKGTTTLALNTEKSSKKVYIVRRGDYIAKIAKRFNVSEEDIRKWNEVSDASIQPGQKIIIHTDT